MFKYFSRKKREAFSEKFLRGILVFENTSDVIRAESRLKDKGWEIRVMGPPSNIRSGCDLVIEFLLIEELSITRELSTLNIKPLQIVPISSELLEPINLFHEKEFGKYIMVRAANMKITVDRESKVIVNVSGGGCPDIPYLAEQMVNKRLSEVVQPREIGHTLCAYALQLAYERTVEIC